MDANKLIAEVLQYFAQLKPEDRVKFIYSLGSIYCLECGDEQPSWGCCQCWNDE